MVTRQINGWKITRIGEITDISRGVSWKTSDEFDKPGEGTIRVYKIPHVQRGLRYQLETDKVYITKPRNHERYLLDIDDILMVGSNGNPDRVGNVVRVKPSEPALFASFLLRLRAKPSVTSEFLYYTLTNEPIQRTITSDSSGSTGLKNINVQKMSEIEIPLPSLPEQRKIAAILTSVDDAIAATQRIIDQTEHVKRGLMQQLLTRGIGHTKFKKTEIGEIPEEWEVVNLEYVCEKIFVGIATSTTNSYTDKGVPIIRNQDIREDILDTSDLLHITPEFSEQNRSKMLQPGDVITVRTGYPGVSCVVPPHLAGAQTFTTLVSRPKPEIINPYFLSRYINSDIGKKFVRGGQAGGAQQNLNVAVFKNMLVPLPSLVEQQRIVSICESIDSKLRTEEAARAQLSLLKTGLMQLLLTGKVRVKVDEEVGAMV